MTLPRRYDQSSAAGEVNDGRTARVSPSGDQTPRGGALWVPGAHAYPVEATGGCGGGRARRSEARGGDGFGHGGNDGYDAGTRGRREGKWGDAHGGLDGVGRELGEGWSGRNVVGDLGRPEAKTTLVAAMQSVRRRVTRWRGRGSRGDARGLVGEARPWRWARQQRAAATARSVVLARERNGRG